MRVEDVESGWVNQTDEGDAPGSAAAG